MKVLITTDSYKPAINGVVTSIINLKAGLEKLGHEVKIITLSNSKKSYCDGEVYYIGSVDMGKLYPGVRMKAKSATDEMTNIINWHPDIIHSQSEFSTYIIAKKIAKKLSIPLIHTYHTVYEDYTHYFSPNKTMGKKAVQLITRRIAYKTDCMVAPTRKVKTILESYGVSSPIEVIPSGICLDKFHVNVDAVTINQVKTALGIEHDSTVLVSVSRVCKEKNIVELIHFIKASKNVKLKLVIVGDGPYREALEKLVRSLGVTDQVKFTGMISPSEISLYYKIADLFVSASQSETQGLTYIEALATGTPILCRKDPCLEEILIEGENGYSYESQDEFFEKLNAFQLTSSKNEMSTNAMITAQQYSIETFAKNVEALYRKYRQKKKEDVLIKENRNVDFRARSILSALCLLLFGALAIYGYQKGLFTSIESLQNLVATAGVMGPIVFLLSQVIQVVVPIIPGGLGCLAGVVLFGPVWGFIYNYIGIVVGSLIVFAISKKYGQWLMPKIFSQRHIDKYMKWTEEKGRFKKMFAAAIFFPVAPDDLLCYIAGTTKMNWKDYSTIICLGKPLSIAAYSLGLTAVFKQLMNLSV